MFGPGGCTLGVYRATFNDVQTDQPWAGPGRKVTAKIKVRVDFVRVDERLIWRSRGKEWSAGSLAAECNHRLKSVGIYRVPREYDRAGNELPKQGSDNLRMFWPNPDGVKWVYSESVTVVCVDPLIAIICDDPVEVPAFTRDKGVMDHQGEWFVDAIEHSLGDSTFYGTKGKCSSNLRWISPDLSRGPEALSFEHDGAARVETSWGYLEVRSDGQQWTTQAVGHPKRP